MTEEKQVGEDLMVEISESTGEREEYKTLQPEEPVKLNVVGITETIGTYNGEEKEQYRVYFKVAEGEPVGAGQVYSDWINKPRIKEGKLQMSPKSKLYELLTKVYPGGLPEGKTFTQMLLGAPVRAEFKAPNANGYQYIERYKSPTTDQKPVEIESNIDPMAEAVKAFGEGVTEVK